MIGRYREILAPETLFRNTYGLTPDEDSSARHKAHSSLALELAAEGAFRLVPLDPAVLALSAKDHFAAAPTFSFSFSFSPALGGVRMMSSISPYSFAASEVRKYSGSVSCVTFSIFCPL